MYLIWWDTQLVQPSIGSIAAVCSAQMKMSQQHDFAVLPSLMFFSASPTLTVPHFSFKTWLVSVVREGVVFLGSSV